METENQVVNEIVVLSLKVQTEGDFNRVALRDNVLDGVLSHRANVGLTANDDENAFVSSVDVLRSNTVYSAFSREQGRGGEVISILGVRVNKDDAIGMARSKAESLTKQYREQQHREVDFSPIEASEIGEGFVLSVEDEGAVAFVIVQQTQLG